jgi:ABC-type Mn2+/Zn2+ transport system ATPase subunit
MKKFRLISIELSDSEEFDKGLYQFSHDSMTAVNSVPYTTLVIGPNGTGKSRLLKIVLDIFNDLYNYRNSGTADYRFKHYYSLIYELDNDIYEIENQRKQVFKKNGIAFNDISEIELPTKAIAAAYSLYEKFTPKSPIRYAKEDERRRTRYDNDFYEYVGVKSERNYTFSGAYINKAIDLITGALAAEGFSKDVKHVFDLLKFQPRIQIKYSAKRNRELFTGKLDISKFQQAIKETNFQRAGFNYSTFQRLSQSSDSYLEEIIKSLNELSEILSPQYEITLDLVFEASKSQALFRRKYKHISLLRSLNIISIGEVLVRKKIYRNPEGLSINLKSMSSGEIQILTSMLALSSIVKESSLILIDEPEISLHPNWQIKYVQILNNVFRNYNNCHFIIATHSHFLVSDLKDSCSSILSLKFNNKLEITPEFVDYSTEGWSAENILYNVFDVSTVRNHYFETDLRTLLSLISNRSKILKNRNKIRNLVEKFEKFNILPSDPLSVIIKNAKKVLDESKQ